MAGEGQSTERIPCYCALCVSRCGSIVVIEDGRFTALEPDPSHPTGKVLCAKGRAAPELVYHADRLRYPLKPTRPKGNPDPGWQRISWDEALDLTAARLREIAAGHGPESVAFSAVSPSRSASDDSVVWSATKPPTPSPAPSPTAPTSARSAATPDRTKAHPWQVRRPSALIRSGSSFLISAQNRRPFAGLVISRTHLPQSPG